jgi:hypothetical protein
VLRVDSRRQAEEPLRLVHLHALFLSSAASLSPCLSASLSLAVDRLSSLAASFLPCLNPPLAVLSTGSLKLHAHTGEEKARECAVRKSSA